MSRAAAVDQQVGGQATRGVCYAAEVVLRTTWGKLSPPPPAQVRGDLPCIGGVYSYVDGWERRALYCSEDCRLCQEIHFLNGKLE